MSDFLIVTNYTYNSYFCSWMLPVCEVMLNINNISNTALLKKRLFKKINNLKQYKLFTLTTLYVSRSIRQLFALWVLEQLLPGRESVQ